MNLLARYLWQSVLGALWCIAIVRLAAIERRARR